MRRAITWLALGLVACDVEASLGAQDAGPLDGAMDAPATIDAGTDVGVDAFTGDAFANDAFTSDAFANDAGECAPPDADACHVCQATTCCPVYAPCERASHCRCIVDCVVSGGTMTGCTTHCGADHGESAPMITCAQNHCSCP